MSWPYKLWEYKVELTSDKMYRVFAERNGDRSPHPIARWDYFFDEKEAEARAEWYRQAEKERSES